MTPLQPDRALSLALVHYLSEEMPDIEFTLVEPPSADAVWVCGHEQSAPGLVRRLRARHPSAVIVVTERSESEGWKREVLTSGADFACSWPLDYTKMDRILHRAHVEAV